MAATSKVLGNVSPSAVAVFFIVVILDRFLTMLRAVLRLAGRAAPADSAALVRDAAALIGFASDGLTEPTAYLDAVTRTAEYVNRMERNPS